MPFNSIFSWVIKKRIHQIDLFKKFPIEVQNEVFEKQLEALQQTGYFKSLNKGKVESYEEFKAKIPLQKYNHIKPWVDRLMTGEQTLLWPTETRWFAKSSGTTSSRSKLIPVTKESLVDCHYKGGKDLLGMYYSNHPNTRLFNGRHLIVGGSAEVNQLSERSYFGDLSAIIVKNLPWWCELRRTPSKKIALMSDWEEKIEKMAQSTLNEDVHIIAGVPSWTMVLANRILEISGKNTLKEVWPNLELFMHGGVSFDPYREGFEKIIGCKEMNYIETYNASEGFFGIQDGENGMLLMLDYGIFYEFIPMESYQEEFSQNVIPLEQVQKGVNYAMVISTNGGLWRYIIGDTVEFTSISPYRIKITGRTKSFINAFGEELIVENAEKAIAEACKITNAQIKEYTACPIYMENNESGAHEWCIEFSKQPNEMERFESILDETLRKINSDYDAKRFHNFVLNPPKINTLPKGTFDQWLRSKGKLGGQNKIPRLSNSREFVEQLLSLIEKKSTNEIAF